MHEVCWLIEGRKQFLSTAGRIAYTNYGKTSKKNSINVIFEISGDSLKCEQIGKIDKHNFVDSAQSRLEVFT